VSGNCHNEKKEKRLKRGEALHPQLAALHQTGKNPNHNLKPQLTADCFCYGQANQTSQGNISGRIKREVTATGKNSKKTPMELFFG